ncbi:MAG: regulatory protein GemA [Psychromonas sp.]
MAYPISINTLKAKINIAKTQLGMDEDVYRAVLKDVTGKTSLTKMNFAELMMVVHGMEQRGFKAKKPANKNGKRYSAPSGQTAFSRKPQDKIIAIWITMHRQGFIEDGSETALDKFINNQTQRSGMFAVTSLRFLSPPQASKVMEVLKKWHIRVIKKTLKQHGICSGQNDGVMPYLEYVNYFESVAPVLNSQPEIDTTRRDEVLQ